MDAARRGMTACDADTVPGAPVNAVAMIALSEAARVRLASDLNASDDMLRALTVDGAVTVRASLAMNAALGDGLVDTIARDPDDRVRAVLAQRLAALLPSLSESHRAHLQARAVDTLMTLAADEAVRVRAAITEVVKDMADVPHALVRLLASDSAFCVADPVIRLSPMLSVADLLGLVSDPPSDQTVTAVARRPGLAARVADAIAMGPDPSAIAALIANPSACLSEATLDLLIARAAAHMDWHVPLVRRHHLSDGALRSLAALVSGQVLAELALRTDLSAALAAEIGARLGPMRTADAEPAGRPRYPAPSLSDAVRLAQEMADARTLTESAILAAARRGEARLCSAMLSVAGHVPQAVVERAITLRSTKGLLSLIWRAGFSMRAAGPLQTLLVRLPPEHVLHPSDTGGFPLSEQEMAWQIEFLTRVGRADGRGR